MNRFLISISVLSLIFCSCDKNKEMVRYIELYHIEGNDTISAIYIPNSFTPNHDSSNDYFESIDYGIISDFFLLSIYDANGMLIFETSHLNQNWDGSYKGLMSPSGTYTVKIFAEDSSGFKYNHTSQFESMR